MGKGGVTSRIAEGGLKRVLKFMGIFQKGVYQGDYLYGGRRNQISSKQCRPYGRDTCVFDTEESIAILQTLLQHPGNKHKPLKTTEVMEEPVLALLLERE